MPRLILFLALIFTSPIHAADITGQVTVLEKSGLKALNTSANCLIFIKNLNTAPPGEAAWMEQRGKRFIPRLLPVVSGQEVRFLNADAISHNVFSPHPTEPFDLGFYATDQHKSFWFREPGPHKIYCNIHQKMIADVFVVPNRYHTTTDDKGTFRLASVPEGTHTIGVWHILGGTEEKTVVLNQDPVRLEFTLISQKIIKALDEHPDKFGNDYRREDANETKRY